MDFDLTEEQKMLQRNVRDFLRKEIAPIVPVLGLPVLTAFKRYNTKNQAVLGGPSVDFSELIYLPRAFLCAMIGLKIATRLTWARSK